LGTNPPQRFHFFKRLPHAEQTNSTARGINNSLRDSPPQLLSDFVAHGFLAFDAIRFFGCADVEPSFLVPEAFGFQLSDSAGTVADQTVDEGDVRAVVI